LTREGFYSGNSLPVNKALLTIFIITGFAEQSGHGVPIIVSEYGRDAFSFENNMLKVSIRFSYEPDQVEGRKERERKMLTLTENQQNIINYVRDNPDATQEDIANWTGLSLSGTKKNMRFLQEIGLLERSGSKKYGMWKIK
jgi:predicted HTH transcriptional regulator